MQLDWNDISVDFENLDESTLLQSWQWLIGSMQPMMITSVGDVFLKNESGEMYWLLTGSAQLNKVADTYEEFFSKLEENEIVDDWFLTSVVLQLKDAGVLLEQGVFYGFKDLPVFGGKYEFENFELTDIEDYFELTGRVHFHIKTLTSNDGISVMNSPGYEFIYKQLRGEISYEANLIVQRTSWFVASQAFLFASLAIGIDPNMNPRTIEGSIYFPIIPILGVVMCSLTILSVQAAVDSAAASRNMLNDFVRNHQEFNIVWRKKRKPIYRFGLLSTQIIPYPFAFFWGFILFQGYSDNLRNMTKSIIGFVKVIVANIW